MTTQIQNPVKLDFIQESSDILYSMLLNISSKEGRTDEDQIYIDTLIQVLKSLPSIKPIEFNLFF